MKKETYKLIRLIGAGLVLSAGLASFIVYLIFATELYEYTNRNSISCEMAGETESYSVYICKEE